MAELAYVEGKRQGILTDWHGNRIGGWQTVSTHKRYGRNIGPYTIRHIYATLYDQPEKRFHGSFNEDWSQAVMLRPYKERN